MPGRKWLQNRAGFVIMIALPVVAKLPCPKRLAIWVGLEEFLFNIDN
jgi:hypothetical protein